MRIKTIKEVRAALQGIKDLEEAGQASHGMTSTMREAVQKLQERQANLDKQWQRATLLDEEGIWKWDDDESSKNRGKPDVRLWPEAREWNDRKIKRYSEQRRQLMEQYENDVRLQEDPPPLVLTARPQAASATSSSSGLPPSARARYRLAPRAPTPPQRENELPGTKPKRTPRPPNKRKPPEEAQEQMCCLIVLILAFTNRKCLDSCIALTRFAGPKCVYGYDRLGGS